MSLGGKCWTGGNLREPQRRCFFGEGRTTREQSGLEEVAVGFSVRGRIAVIDLQQGTRPKYKRQERFWKRGSAMNDMCICTRYLDIVN